LRVLICGSRTWTDEQRIEDYIKKLPWDAVVIVGDANGADKIANRLALKHDHVTITCPAKWKIHGRRAGVIRNQEMLLWNPNSVVAFQIGNSAGTLDMIDRARKAMIRKIEVFKE
jgi:hypothetical protein